MQPINTPERVKAARLALGLTQEGLADLLRLRGDQAKDTVRSWEAGRRDISGPTALALELLLESRGLTIDERGPTPFARILGAITDPQGVAGEQWAEESREQWQTRAVQVALRRRD